MQDHYRQGDVFLLKTDRVPGWAKVTAKKRLVLAEGEVTGHAHVIDAPGAELKSAYGQNYVSLPESATLVHEEHGPITLPAGDYLLLIQRVYDPRGGSRDVLD